MLELSIGSFTVVAVVGVVLVDYYKQGQPPSRVWILSHATLAALGYAFLIAYVWQVGLQLLPLLALGMITLAILAGMSLFAVSLHGGMEIFYGVVGIHIAFAVTGYFFLWLTWWF